MSAESRGHLDVQHPVNSGPVQPATALQVSSSLDLSLTQSVYRRACMPVL